jgi:DNA-directed RNA polymerase subunit RPC12/RpoP
MSTEEQEEKQPAYVHCADCRHEWPAFYTPLLMDAKGMKLLKWVGKSRCPKCAGKRVMMGRNIDAGLPSANGEEPQTVAGPVESADIKDAD